MTLCPRKLCRKIPKKNKKVTLVRKFGEIVLLKEYLNIFKNEISQIVFQEEFRKNCIYKIVQIILIKNF